MNVTKLLETNRLFFQLIRGRKNALDSRVTNTDTAVSSNDTMDILKDAVVGDYKWSARTSDFFGWLVCDGRSLSRTDYSDLFDVIGTSFGSDNATTFRLPDLRGRTPCAIGQGSGLTNRTIGTYVGAETHTLSSNEIPGHTHTGTTQSNGSHDHGGATGSNGAHTHSFAMAKDDGNSSHSFGQYPAGDASKESNTYYVSTESAGTHSHTIASDGTHTHTFTTDSTGGGQAHNNMQPSVFIGNMFIYSGKRPITLSALRSWARLAQSAYANLANSYLYRYDATVGNGVHYHIADGDDNMFDNGNYTYITGNVFQSSELTAKSQVVGSNRALAYGSEFVNETGVRGFYVSDPNTYPHLVFTFSRNNGSLGIRSFGGTGTGSSSVMNVNGSYTCIDGRTGLFWANVNYNTVDPTIGEVWFTITSEDWDGSYVDDNTLVDSRKSSDPSDGTYDQTVQITGTNFAFCKVLLSKSQGTLITVTEIEEFLSNYVQSMPLSLVFV